MLLWLTLAILVPLALVAGFFGLMAMGVIRGDIERSPEEVVSYIRNFVAQTGDDRDWDDFTSIRIRDADLDSIRIRCNRLHDEHPPEIEGEWCSATGREMLTAVAAELDLDAV